MKSLNLFILTAVAAAVFAGSQTALTIYNDNLGVVKEVRDIEFEKGTSRVEFTDVAETIDPTSVSFRPMEDAEISLLEQNYEYDLVDPYKLLEKYIGKKITLFVQRDENVAPLRDEYELLAFKGNDFVVRSRTGIHILNRDLIKGVRFGEEHGDMLTKPTLVWLADSDKDQTLPCQVAYMVSRISWKANYSMILSDSEKQMEFSGWVTIDNKSGKDFKNAKIKLIAGDVKQEQPQTNRRMEQLYAAASKDSGSGFKEKAFQDFHLYTLGRKSTVNNKQVKQIRFIENVKNVDIDKTYKLSSQIMNTSKHENNPSINFEFVNSEENAMGMPLPEGLIRAFKEDKEDGSLEFVGESGIKHTPKDEKVKVQTGKAFDIVGEFKTVKADVRNARVKEFLKEAVIRNHKDEDCIVEVDFKYPAGYSNCRVYDNNLDYEKPEAGIIRFEVPVKSNDETKITFEAQISR
ncbi:hypothetical protein L21SP3_00979 [Sedimentisphaera cyanobacteriorum]|uniref:DUF4139 domain-containing protein n=1 Tax=Sedimentisphaera cyanobacteriorum TaxID=1940790 RepID=A0A1Q2HNW1_9BACT|nr:DUF4139 domain-containing protein [Sedimentisphaera cyanobacteriorum]AQQ09179.1 hypothetical protein L21SP3_00979 [Sedimentisphaera cyanobacteriorum]